MTNREDALAALEAKLEGWGDHVPEFMTLPTSFIRDLIGLIRDPEAGKTPRLLTLEELKALQVGAVIWEEYVEDDHAHDHLYLAVKGDEKFIVTVNGAETIADNMLEHDNWGYQSRYWSAKPTDEMRKGAAWDG